MQTSSRKADDSQSDIAAVGGRVRSWPEHVGVYVRIAFAKPARACWLVIYCLALSTASIACSMSNLHDESLPNDLIVYVQEHRIDLRKYSVERAESGGKLVIYLLDKELPNGYRGSRPGVPQYEFVFDRTTKKMLSFSLMR